MNIEGFVGRSQVEIVASPELDSLVVSLLAGRLSLQGGCFQLASYPSSTLSRDPLIS